MSIEPICQYENEEQLIESLREWQTRLFLDDWIIRVALVDSEDMPDMDCDGYNKRFNTIKACKIWVSRPRKDEPRCLVRHCEEEILVHELLHCKPWLSHYAQNEGNAAACYLEQHEHTMLEQMARSLIMAKYDVGREWFRNFDMPTCASK